MHGQGSVGHASAALVSAHRHSSNPALDSCSAAHLWLLREPALGPSFPTSQTAVLPSSLTRLSNTPRCSPTSPPNSLSGPTPLRWGDATGAAQVHASSCACSQGDRRAGRMGRYWGSTHTSAHAPTKP